MQFDTERLIACGRAFAGKRTLVIGDVILDEYIYGRAERLSREAPIPVLEYTHRDLIPGGAANPSANIASLGGQPLQIGVIGVDNFGEQLRDALRTRQIDPAGLVIDPQRPTTTKTRIMAQMGLRFPQQIARIDQIDRNTINGEIEQKVIETIRTCAANQHALIASDYMSGLLTPAVVDAIRESGRKVNALLTADAQGQLDKYAGFDLVKCNADEAARYVRHDLPDDAAFAEAGAGFVRRLGLRGGMLITRGSDGLTLVEADGTVTHIRAPHIEDVFDTVGAGDTALAVLTLGRIAGATLPEAAALANIAAGFVVRKVGNYAPSPDELIEAIRAWNR
jgi:D-glycero-beta-D-manno-heptose-7-phosphate kinase